MIRRAHYFPTLGNLDQKISKHWKKLRFGLLSFSNVWNRPRRILGLRPPQKTSFSNPWKK